MAPGTPCIDGDACTIDDECSAGACSGTPLAVPGEVQDLTVSGAAGTTVTWTAQSESVAYDVAGGLVSSLAPDAGVSNAGCVGADLSASPFTDGRADPPEGDAYYYIVRGQNACAQNGTYGYASGGGERMPLTPCP